jgi:redox-sensitive bicupin YhaK (pirin superfamily)
MIKLFPRKSRYQANHGWLQSNFSFSFAEYDDPDNTSFGPMRVLNDDYVEAHRGFGAHPHREMEIVSIVLSGALKHQDSAGHSATTHFGSVQRMSAGTGIIHSEMNPESETVNFLQMWFTPKENGISPSYETTDFEPNAMMNALLPVVSHQSSTGVAYIHQDLTIYLSKLEAGRSLTFTQSEGRKIFLFVIEGDLILNGKEQLSTRDSARMTETQNLQLYGKSDIFYMLIDLP